METRTCSWSKCGEPALEGSRFCEPHRWQFRCRAAEFASRANEENERWGGDRAAMRRRRLLREVPTDG